MFIELHTIVVSYIYKLTNLYFKHITQNQLVVYKCSISIQFIIVYSLKYGMSEPRRILMSLYVIIKEK